MVAYQKRQLSGMIVRTKRVVTNRKNIRHNQKLFVWMLTVAVTSSHNAGHVSSTFNTSIKGWCHLFLFLATTEMYIIDTFKHTHTSYIFISNKSTRTLTSNHSSYWCCLHKPCFALWLNLTNVSFIFLQCFAIAVLFFWCFSL